MTKATDTKAGRKRKAGIIFKLMKNKKKKPENLTSSEIELLEEFYPFLFE